MSILREVSLNSRGCVSFYFFHSVRQNEDLMAGTWAATLDLGAWVLDAHRVLLPTLNAQPQDSFIWEKNKLYLAKAPYFACSLILSPNCKWCHGLPLIFSENGVLFCRPFCIQCSLLSSAPTLFCPHFLLLCVSWQSTHCQGPSQCLLHDAFPNLPFTRFSHSLDFSSTFHSLFSLSSYTGHLWTNFTPVLSLLCEGR